MKKGIFLITVTLLLIAAWSSAWFYVTGKVETTLKDTKIKLSERGKNFQCANQNIDGYPFRISLNCDAVHYTDNTTGLSFKTGALRSAAQAYQPNKAIVELSSPANLTLPNADRYNATWNSLRSSFKANLEGLENVSMQGQKISLIPENNPAQTVLFEDLQLHGRKIGENNINLAFSLGDASSQKGLWPSFDFNTTLLLEDVYSQIINRASLLLVAQTRGLKGQIETFQYSPKDGGMLIVSGPAEVKPNGLLSGNFEVTVRDLASLISALGKSFPSEKKKFDDAAGTVSLLAKGSGSNEITLPIIVRNGTINVGFIPVGKLKPLF